MAGCLWGGGTLHWCGLTIYSSWNSQVSQFTCDGTHGSHNLLM